MNKRFFAILLTVIMVVCTAACGTAQPTTQPAPAPAAEVKPETTPAPEVAEPEPTEAPKEEPEVGGETTEEPKEEAPEVEEVVEGTEKDDLFVLNGTNYKGERIDRNLIEEYAEYDSLKAFVVSERDGILVDILSDGESFEETKEMGECYFFIYAPQKVSKQKNISGEGCMYLDEHLFDGKVTATCSFAIMKTGKDVPFGIEVTYEDGTEDSITFYVTKEY